MNRKRVQMLRDMIAGIPARRLHLDEVFKGDMSGIQRAPKPCGAVACMAGWAWIYPPFIRQGIRKNCPFPADRAPHFFGTYDEDHRLFWSRQIDETGTDKQIALRRLDKLLATGTDSTTT